MRQPCPICGAPAPVQPTYKHRWTVCGACGNAVRHDRERLPTGLLPERLAARLPAGTRRDRRFHADPEGAYFADVEGRLSAFEAEADDFEALLDRLGLRDGGPFLDLSGGPGFVAARVARRGRRAVLLEYARPALRYAREQLGIDARFHDFDGPGPEAVVDGPFALFAARFSLGWCLDLPRLAAGLTALAAPGAALVALLVQPGRAAFLTCALEDHGPRVLWSPEHLARVFGALGWSSEARFEPFPPMPYWRPRGPAYRLWSLPWELRPGPAPRDPLQRHAGLVLRYGGG